MSIEDASLIQKAIQKGDEQVFKMLFDKHYLGLVAYINGYTNDYSQSQDIIQDTYLKLWNAKANIDFEQSVSGYLYKIAYNTYVNNYNHQKKSKQFLDDLAHQKRMEMLTDNEDFKKQKLDSVKKAIENLPPKCQKIFKMSKIEGYKYQEIADMLQISIKTVEAQMGKAFSSIRKELHAKGFIALFLDIFGLSGLFPSTKKDHCKNSGLLSPYN